MPMYVYRCSACEASVEELQKMDDPPPQECPECQAKGTLEKVLGVSNFSLKPGGVGWANNGYSG